MKKSFLLAVSLGAVALLAAGCNVSNTNQTNNQAQQKEEAFDLSSKCSKDAESYFNKNWKSSDSDQSTILLNYTNHYNTALNKCFILIEYHFWLAQKSGLWDKDISLYDVEDVTKYGEVSYQQAPGNLSSNNKLLECDLLGKKCASVDDFMNQMKPYMNN